MGKAFWLFFSGIFYTYIGYPLIITILSRIFPQKRDYTQEYLSTTLLIAAYNEESVIEEKIKNSLKLDYPSDKIQILIITDGSDDKTPTIVKDYSLKGVDLLHQPERRGKMAAINRALPYARGEIIVFSDANNFYNTDTIMELVKPFSDPRVGAVCGAKGILSGDGSLGESDGLYWKYEAMIQESEDRFGSCTSAAAEILALRKTVYTHPPGSIINDDFYQIMQTLRSGYRVAYAPKARSFERVSISAEHEIQRRSRIIAGRYQAISLAPDLLPIRNPILLWQIISHKFMRPLVPFFMIGMFITNIVSILKPSQDLRTAKKLQNLQSPYNRIFMVGQVLFYGLAKLGNNPNHQENENSWSKLLYLPTFLVNSNIAALQGFFQYIRGKQTTLWERMPRRGP